LKNWLFILCAFLPALILGQDFKFPKVVQSNQKKGTLRIANTKEAWHTNIQYMGKYQDTISLSDNTDSIIHSNLMPYELAKKYYYNDRFSAFIHLADTLIDIFIDTSQILTFLSSPYNKKRVYRNSYQAYPVILRNNSDSFAVIGFGNDSPVLIEALDIDNVWKFITCELEYRCGTGLRNIYLKAGSVVCLLIPKFKGNFKTKLRLKFNNIVSNTFSGHINRSQFYN